MNKPLDGTRVLDLTHMLSGPYCTMLLTDMGAEKLNSVKQALYEKEIYKMSVTNALGCGQQKGYHESYRGVDIEVNLLKKVRLEIAVNDDFVQPTIDAADTTSEGAPRIFRNQ